MFRSNEVPDLHDLYGSAFEEKYEHYEKLAEDGKIWSHKMPAGSEAMPLSLPLPKGEDLTIKVEFDGPLTFPCGVDLRDAYVLTTLTNN